MSDARIERYAERRFETTDHHGLSSLEGSTKRWIGRAEMNDGNSIAAARASELSETFATVTREFRSRGTAAVI